MEPKWQFTFFLRVFELRWVQAAGGRWGSSGGDGGGDQSLTSRLRHHLAAPQLLADRRQGWTNHSRGLEGFWVIWHQTVSNDIRRRWDFERINVLGAAAAFWIFKKDTSSSADKTFDKTLLCVSNFNPAVWLCARVELIWVWSKKKKYFEVTQTSSRNAARRREKEQNAASVF